MLLPTQHHVTCVVVLFFVAVVVIRGGGASEAACRQQSSWREGEFEAGGERAVRECRGASLAAAAAARVPAGLGSRSLVGRASSAGSDARLVFAGDRAILVAYRLLDSELL